MRNGENKQLVTYAKTQVLYRCEKDRCKFVMNHRNNGQQKCKGIYAFVHSVDRPSYRTLYTQSQVESTEVSVGGEKHTGWAEKWEDQHVLEAKSAHLHKFRIKIQESRKNYFSLNNNNTLFMQKQMAKNC